MRQVEEKDESDFLSQEVSVVETPSELKKLRSAAQTAARALKRRKT